MKEILSKRLDELINSVKDTDYTKSIPVQCREMGIPYPTFKKYQTGISEPSATYLAKIAEYYNVSVDYLLGVSDAKTLDMDISGCCKLTGLSEAAVNTIISNHDLCGKLSELLEDNKTWAFIKALEIADNMKQNLEQ